MLLVAVFTFAAFTPSSPVPVAPNANEIMIPLGGTEGQISLKELSAISMGDLEKMTGKKMGFLDKVSFKLTQKKLKKAIAEDGTIQSKKLKKQAAMMMAGGTDGLALAAGISGIVALTLGLVFWPLGLAAGIAAGIMGIISLGRFRDNRELRGQGWAITGIIASGLWIVLLLLGLFALALLWNA